MGDSLFAAYDPLDIKNAKYLIVTSSDYPYTPRSLFWPDVIFLTAPKLVWGQAVSMAISVQIIVSMEPKVMIMAGSNDHLQSRGLLARLTDGSVPSNEVMGEAIMTLLSALTEVRIAVRQRFGLKKGLNSASGHLMACNEMNGMQGYLQELTENSNLKRKGHTNGGTTQIGNHLGGRSGLMPV